MGKVGDERGPIRDDRVHEVEAERLPRDAEEPEMRFRGRPKADSKKDPFLGAYGPVLAGLAIDLADFVTPLGLGSKFGIPVGAVVGWWVAKRLGLPLERRIFFACAGAAYCSMSNTSRIPLGTVIGLLSRLGGVR